MKDVRILVLSGSIRAGSYNTQLAGLVAKHAALADARVTQISLADYPMPIFDQDLEKEKGLPEAARKLKAHWLSLGGWGGGWGRNFQRVKQNRPTTPVNINKHMYFPAFLKGLPILARPL